MANNEADGLVRVEFEGKGLAKGKEKAVADMQAIGKQSDATTQKIVANDSKLTASAKKRSEAVASLEEKAIARVKGKEKLVGTRSAARQAEITAKGTTDKELEGEKRLTEGVKIEGRKQVINEEHKQKRLTVVVNAGIRARLKAIRDGEEAARRLSQMAAQKADPWRQLAAGSKVSGLSPSAALFGNINQGLGLYNSRQQSMMAGATQWRTGVTPSQLWQQQMNTATARAAATNANYFGPGGPGGPPPTPPNRPPGGGGRGRGSIWQRLAGGGGGGVAGTMASSLLGGLGIGVGGYALAHVSRAIIEGEKLATTYDRQTVAARSLAGGQDKLNVLLEAYNKASGGAVTKTDALANTSRLLATGMAKNAAEFTKFVRGTRGASIAMGVPETEVQEQTQLAIANTSKRRLDQIGLGVKEVDERIVQLRKNNKGWNREMAFSEAIISLLDEKYGGLTKTIEGQATGVEKLEKSWADLGLTLAKVSKTPIDKITGGISGAINAIGQGIENRNKSWARETLNEFNVKDFFGATTFDIIGAFSGRTGTQVKAQHVLNNPSLMPNSPSSGYIGGPADYRPSTNLGPSDDEMAVRRSSYEQVQALEKQYSQQRLAATTQYEVQRASIIRNFGKQMAREEADFARQRARGLRDYEKQIVDIMRDAQERDAEMREDYNKQLADINEDSGKRVAKIEENFRENREKAEREHRDKLLSAAGQLDAIAVLEERKRWREDNKERNKQHDEALKDERESTEERRADALEAYTERLDDARKADKKRLEDMAADRAQQLADEDVDRGIQKQRAIEDHNDELAEMERQHNAQMAELERQYAENKTALEEALAADLAAVNVYIEGYQQRLEKKDKLIEEWLDEYILKLEKKFKDEVEAKRKITESEVGPRLSYDSGGPVRRTGPAIVHAGEYVLSRSMLAAGWSPTNNYNQSSSNIRHIEMHAGALQVITTPGMEGMVGELVEAKFIEMMEAA